MNMKQKFVGVVFALSMLPTQLFAESIEFKPTKGAAAPSVSFDFEGEVLQPPVEVGVN